jgi:uncharacterized repeat protein (TIGR03803 family)
MPIQQQLRQKVSISTVVLVPTLLVVLMTVASPVVRAQSYSVLHTFSGGPDGGSPYAGLTIDAAGNFYGSNYCGGDGDCPEHGNGVIFKLTRAGSDWVLKTLYTFQGGEDGSEADGGITIGPDGALYGTTYYGGGNGCSGAGCGTVYRLTPPATICKAVSCPWTETVIHRFGLADGDGSLPVYGKPLFDRAGNLYGTTKGGGAFGNGTVYELTPSSGGWTENILWSFSGNGGIHPVSSLIFDSEGNLYGTSADGGTYNSGTVFELSPAGSGWAETTLFSFDYYSTGDSPSGGLAWDAQGNLYGTTSFGGPLYGGTVFQLAPVANGWRFSQVMAFSYYQGPDDTPTLDSAGNIYLSAYSTGSLGAIFKLTQSQGTWTSATLHSFSGSNGSYPVGSVVLDANGNVYGTTFGGGANHDGVVFEITP